MKTFQFSKFFTITDNGYYSCSEHSLKEFNKILNQDAGYFLLKGFPVDGSSEKEIQTNIFKFAFTFGVPISETKYNDFILRLEDVDTAGKNAKSKVRNRPLLSGQENARAIPVHNDRSDLLVLFGVKPSKKGGQTFFVSSNQVCIKLYKEYPKQFKVLQKPFHYSYQGVIQEIPIISKTSNGFIVWYVRPRIEKLSQEKLEALDILDLIINEFKESVILQNGDVCIANNHKALHGRRRFPKGDDRLLYRIWLSTSNGQQLPESYQSIFRHTKPGSYRGGVWSNDFDMSLIPSDIDIARENIMQMLIGS